MKRVWLDVYKRPDLNGIFAFALYDEEKDDFLIARDPIGVIPLYIGRDKDLSLIHISSTSSARR